MTLKGSKSNDLSSHVWGTRLRWRCCFNVGVMILLVAWISRCVALKPNAWTVYKKKRAEYARLQLQIQQLQQELDDRERRVKALKDDPRAMEEEARKELGYVRPGEFVYLIPKSEVRSVLSARNPEVDSNPRAQRKARSPSAKKGFLLKCAIALVVVVLAPGVPRSAKFARPSPPTGLPRW
jgi:cell division protein FtsB